MHVYLLLRAHLSYQFYMYRCHASQDMFIVMCAFHCAVFVSAIEEKSS